MKDWAWSAVGVAAAASFAFLVVALTSPVQQQWASEDQHRAAYTKDQTQSIGQARTSENGLPKSEVAAQGQQAESNKKNDQGWGDYVKDKIADMLVAFFTAALTWIAFQQTRIIKINQRAYISADPLGIQQRRPGEPWFAIVGIRNAGLLPARDVRWEIAIEHFTRNGDWKDFIYVDGLKRGNHVIPSGTTMRRGSRPFSVDRRYQDDRFMYVWGEVEYTDGFGVARYTHFCHRYNAKAIVPDGKEGFCIPAEDARYHDHGNDAT